MGKREGYRAVDGSYVSYERGFCGDPMCDGACMINAKITPKGASSDLEFDRPPTAPACPHNANPHSCPTCRLPFAEFIVKSIQRSIEEFSGSGEEVRLNQRLWDKLKKRAVSALKHAPKERDDGI